MDKLQGTNDRKCRAARAVFEEILRIIQAPDFHGDGDIRVSSRAGVIQTITPTYTGRLLANTN